MTDFHLDESYFESAFQQVDEDNDGKLTLIEAIQAFSLCGIIITKEEMNDIFTQDPTKPIEFPTFLKILYEKQKPIDDEKELLQAFRLFDRKKEGIIDAAEFRTLVLKFGRYTEEEIDTLLKDADPANIGGISYTRFIKLMKQS